MVRYSPADNRYEKMQYKFCGASGLKLPAISVGLWHNFGGTDDFLNAALSLRKAFDCGITHFDLANNYGMPPGSAEENFGKISKKRFSSVPRRTYYIDKKRGIECGRDRTAIGDQENI